MNGINRGLTWDEKAMNDLLPMSRAEVYLKDFKERWPTPTKELDREGRIRQELDQLQWRNELMATGFLNGPTERALRYIALEEGAQKKK